MLEWWQAIILGLVEGITEYLPVSSTGHLILTAGLLGLNTPATKPALDAFNIVVQGGAILAVLGLYRARVFQMLRGLAGRDPAGLRLLVNIGVAFVPAAVLGYLLNEMIEEVLFHAGPVIFALAAGGVFMILLDEWRTGRFGRVRHSGAEGELESLSWRGALVIGLVQCVALWPGTSRSMMTIAGGVIVRLKPAAAAEFSFLLALPTLSAASLYTLLKDVTNDDPAHRTMFEVLGWAPVIIGMLVAMVSAAAAVHWLVGFLKRRGLVPFGWYRIVLAVVLLGLIVGKVVTLG